MKLIFNLVGNVTMTSVMTLTVFSMGLTLKLFSGVHSTIVPNFILLTRNAQSSVFSAPGTSAMIIDYVVNTGTKASHSVIPMLDYANACCY